MMRVLNLQRIGERQSVHSYSHLEEDSVLLVPSTTEARREGWPLRVQIISGVALLVRSPCRSQIPPLAACIGTRSTQILPYELFPADPLSRPHLSPRSCRGKGLRENFYALTSRRLDQ